MGESIRADVDGRGVLRITLDRPEVRNAMSAEMVDALLQALQRANDDPAVRVIVLRGAGGHFCAGGDIKDMAQARLAPAAASEDPVRTLNARFGRLALAFAAASPPVVAVLEGAVMGGGFGLACTADVVLAATDADFRLPETSLGVVPAQIAPFLVERLGLATARRLALTGARLDGPAAHGVGLVDVVAPTPELDAVLERTLGRILACAPGATRATKALFHRLRSGSSVDAEVIDHAASVFAEAARGAEAAEGMQAFLGKRKPSWHPDAAG